MKAKITVHVKSTKIPIGETLVEQLYPVKRSYSHDAFFEVKRKTLYRYVLPDDQKTLLELVESLSARHGFKFEVNDVGKEDIIKKLWRKLKRINNVPAVEIGHGRTIRPPIHENEIERLISEST